LSRLFRPARLLAEIPNAVAALDVGTGVADDGVARPRIHNAIFSFLSRVEQIGGASVWRDNWLWSLPLIVSTVIIHVIGLGVFNVKMVQVLTAVKDRPRYTGAFALIIGFTAIWATFLHAIEAGIWAAAYLLLKALPDGYTAMLYSVSAITTYGHAQIFLSDDWRLLGALEALNGVILLGMTTALMYGLIQKVWPIEDRALPHVHRGDRSP
jgi:hypothetical protein